MLVNILFYMYFWKCVCIFKVTNALLKILLRFFSVKILFNVPKKYCRVSPVVYHFIKIMQNKTINVYFHKPSRIYEHFKEWEQEV